MINCINCGAPIDFSKPKCEHCGSDSRRQRVYPADLPCSTKYIIAGVMACAMVTPLLFRNRK